MEYRNRKTGQVVKTTGRVTGDNWEPAVKKADKEAQESKPAEEKTQKGKKK